MKVSVIIPALNEAENIRAALSAIGGLAEVIVVDGGSSDNTRNIAEGLGAKVIETPPGRGLQMDTGALSAMGDILLFLHADTRLPSRWLDSIGEAMGDRGNVGGAFGLRIDSDKKLFRLIERAVDFRSRHLGLFYGDQALFARREVFLKAGGYRKLPLMEDVDCVKRLRKLGTLILLDERVTTSPRRWLRGGVVRNTLRNWLMLALYFSGVSPERLYGRYYDGKR